jgi:beta-glucosidase/6-phospho-beta-glucosidase/beta-galactosidase
MAITWPEHAGSKTVTAPYKSVKPVSKETRARTIWNDHVAERNAPDAHSLKDIAWLASLGYKAYRFEIPWPMVVLGPGRQNEKGIAVIKELIAELRKYEMLPIVKVNHWQLPLLVQENGSWVNLKSEELHQYFTQVLHEQFGREVSVWMNQNEPWHAPMDELKLLRAYMQESDSAWEAGVMEWKQAESVHHAYAQYS